MTSVFDLTPAELTAWVAGQGQPAYRAQQILDAIYRQGIDRFEQIRLIPESLRTELARPFTLWTLQPIQARRSEDGTVKFLSRLADGETIETVLIPADSRNTVCVSTQVGCAYACAFCASGLEGFRRNLTAGEIVQQILHVNQSFKPGTGDSPPRGHPTSWSVPRWTVPALLGRPVNPDPRPDGQRPRHRLPAEQGWRPGRGLTNVVFMGMGEPLANYDAVIQAIRILNSPEGLGIGARKITLSTVGLVPRIEQLSKEGLQLELAISLHAPTDDLRGQIMPVNRKYPLKELISACRAYAKRNRRLVTFEYILLADVNDSVEQAQALAKLLKGSFCKVNLIPCHPIPGLPFKRPPLKRMLAFDRALKAGGIVCTLRRSRGLDIEGACGQLRLHHSEGMVKSKDEQSERNHPHP